MNTQHIGYDDRPERFDDLAHAEQETVLGWIRENVRHQKTKFPEWSSYTLKHYLEIDTGLYIANGMFKGAMLRCGFVPDDPDALNWSFYVNMNTRRPQANRRVV